LGSNRPQPTRAGHQSSGDNVGSAHAGASASNLHAKSECKPATPAPERSICRSCHLRCRVRPGNTRGVCGGLLSAASRGARRPKIRLLDHSGVRTHSGLVVAKVCRHLCGGCHQKRHQSLDYLCLGDSGLCGSDIHRGDHVARMRSDRGSHASLSLGIALI
jgi:hypothetical protein